MRVYVCSPLRGADGQPSPENVLLARRLMRAVFDAGHAPFVPHLLYPQVLSESAEDLKVSFAANYAFLDVCDEIWVFARTLSGCSRGMRAEVEYVERANTLRRLTVQEEGVSRQIDGGSTPTIFMPPEFEKIALELGR